MFKNQVMEGMCTCAHVHGCNTEKATRNRVLEGFRFSLRRDLFLSLTISSFVKAHVVGLPFVGVFVW